MAQFIAAMRGKLDIKLAYLSAIVYDLIFMPLFVLYTGGIDSSFYMLFYITISVAAYILTFPFALVATIVVWGTYVALVISDVSVNNIFDFTMRLGFMWVYFLALTYVSQYMRKSENRLLKLFDTLNLRTQELERSQTQLEMIYENTRILASILEPDGVVREIMRILGQTLAYNNYAVVFKGQNGQFYYRARCADRATSFSPKALPDQGNDLLKKVAGSQEGVRVNDLASRDDYHPLNENTLSVAIIPMTSHGQSKGLLVAESPEKTYFTARDEQLLSIVARAAGLALENAELHHRTEELTIIDALTGAYNYRYFVQKFQEEKKRAIRYRMPLSIIMVDIDWFKKLNDSYGHEVGNVVLRDLAGVIKHCIRDVDIFCRYGGEEFVVILPQTPLQEAEHIGERIRHQVEGNIIDVGQAGKIKITVSVGVSSFPENGRSEEDLVSVADEALYQAKDNGKNLVCVV